MMDNRYVILGKLGQGGFGQVFRAYDTKMNREVAIKKIQNHDEDPLLKAESTKQLVSEAATLARLQHPNIVTVYDVGSDDEGLYIVMELINGQTLGEIVKDSILTWDAYKLVLMQSLEALVAAHSINIIHSDLKSSNIMFSKLPSGSVQVKLLDFGLSKIIHNQCATAIANNQEMFGSALFIPPEQYEKTPLDARSDIYSLGCCLYNALTSQYPFKGENTETIMQSHLSHNVQSIEEIRDDIPSWACQWLMWMINRYPNDRPSTATEALNNFLTMNEKLPFLDKHGDIIRESNTQLNTTGITTISNLSAASRLGISGDHTIKLINSPIVESKSEGTNNFAAITLPFIASKHQGTNGVYREDQNQVLPKKITVFGNFSDMPLPEILSIVGRDCGKFIISGHPIGSPIELHIYNGDLLGVMVDGVPSVDILNARSRIVSLIKEPTGDFEFHRLVTSELIHYFQTPLHQLFIACLNAIEEIDSYQEFFPNPFTVFMIAKSRDTVWLDDTLERFYEKSYPSLQYGASSDLIARTIGMHVDQVRLYFFKLRSAGLISPLRQLEHASGINKNQPDQTHNGNWGRSSISEHTYSAELSSRTAGQNLTHVKVADRKSMGFFKRVSSFMRGNSRT